MIEKLLNNKEVCELIGISHSTWREMRQEKPRPKSFGRNLYRESDIAAWMDERVHSRSAKASASAR